MAEPVRARRLSDDEGRRLQQIVRRGTGSPIRLRRAMVIMASASGNTIPAIARLVQGDEDAIRQLIHRFNEIGLACLDPRWAGSRPRLISPDEEAFIITTACTRPETLGQPFTWWSLRKLAHYLTHNRAGRRVQIGRERLRQLLHQHQITFQRTKPGRSPPTHTATPSWPVSNSCAARRCMDLHVEASVRAARTLIQGVVAVVLIAAAQAAVDVAGASIGDGSLSDVDWGSVGSHAGTAALVAGVMALLAYAHRYLDGLPPAAA